MVCTNVNMNMPSFFIPFPSVCLLASALQRWFMALMEWVRMLRPALFTQVAIKMTSPPFREWKHAAKEIIIIVIFYQHIDKAQAAPTKHWNGLCSYACKRERVRDSQEYCITGEWGCEVRICDIFVMPHDFPLGGNFSFSHLVTTHHMPHILTFLN